MPVSLFLFFKQKTAYEMRISDWSSDVCSSDLRIAGDDPERIAATAQCRDRSDGAGTQRVLEREGLRQSAIAGEHGAAATPRCRFSKRPLAHTEPPDILADEIARASCRERVYQYV